MHKYVINYIDCLKNNRKGFHYFFASSSIWAKVNFEALYPNRVVVSVDEV